MTPKIEAPKTVWIQKVLSLFWHPLCTLQTPWPVLTWPILTWPALSSPFISRNKLLNLKSLEIWTFPDPSQPPYMNRKANIPDIFPYRYSTESIQFLTLFKDRPITCKISTKYPPNTTNEPFRHILIIQTPSRHSLYTFQALSRHTIDSLQTFTKLSKSLAVGCFWYTVKPLLWPNLQIRICNNLIKLNSMLDWV